MGNGGGHVQVLHRDLWRTSVLSHTWDSNRNLYLRIPPASYRAHRQHLVEQQLGFQVLKHPNQSTLLIRNNVLILRTTYDSIHILAKDDKIIGDGFSDLSNKLRNGSQSPPFLQLAVVQELLHHI